MADDRFEFIDAHVHFYDLAHPTLRYSWLEPDFVHPIIGDIDGIKTRRYLYKNFVAETRFAGVSGSSTCRPRSTASTPSTRARSSTISSTGRCR